MTERFDGKKLIAMGLKPGPRFGVILDEIQSIEATGPDHFDAQVARIVEREKARVAAEEARRKARVMLLLTREDATEVIYNIEAETPEEADNVAAVTEAMEKLVLTPTVEAATVMPDACPAGSIPVGGVVSARNAIHPGWHSADICCSMYATCFGRADVKAVLDAAHGVTHFGPGGRKKEDKVKMPESVADALSGNNPFFGDTKMRTMAVSHLQTSGDGNHFVFVGKSDLNGDTWLVSHHGSRGFGARLYRAGMEVAERYRRELCPELDKGHAWIPFDTVDGCNYWDALQVVREWTKANHRLLHDAVRDTIGADVLNCRWNEHNFVFTEDGERFLHGKGATPVHDPFIPDTDGVQIVPLSMGHPILFVKGGRHSENLGFAPHGAGRNFSRTEHRKRMEGETEAAIVARETDGLDVRFWCGRPDITELPSAYKNAESVQKQMSRFNLAEVVDRIMPYGCIMAGDWEADAPWRKKRQ